jgi:hypothetical protein
MLWIFLNLSECDLSCPVSAKPSEFVLTLAQYCSRCVTDALKGKTFFREHITINVSKFEYVMQICVIPKCIILVQIGCSTDSTYWALWWNVKEYASYLIEKHCPGHILPAEQKAKPTKKTCSVSQTTHKEISSVLVPWLWA